MEDWTSTNGRANASADFERLVDEVARLIRNDAHALLSGRAHDTARLIVARLAHAYGIGRPTKTPEY